MRIDGVGRTPSTQFSLLFVLSTVFVVFVVFLVWVFGVGGVGGVVVDMAVKVTVAFICRSGELFSLSRSRRAVVCEYIQGEEEGEAASEGVSTQDDFFTRPEGR